MYRRPVGIRISSIYLCDGSMMCCFFFVFALMLRKHNRNSEIKRDQNQSDENAVKAKCQMSIYHPRCFAGFVQCLLSSQWSLLCIKRNIHRNVNWARLATWPSLLATDVDLIFSLEIDRKRKKHLKSIFKLKNAKKLKFTHWSFRSFVLFSFISSV